MKIKGLLTIIAATVLFSCNKMSDTDTPLPSADNMFGSYDLAFVQQAMLEEGLLAPGTTLSPTHRYISATAGTEEALLALKNSGALVMPYDLVTGKRGENGQFYLLLPAEKVLPPAVSVEVIQELYIPRDNERSLDQMLLKRSGYITESESTEMMRRPPSSIRGSIKLEYPENGTYRPLRNAELVAIENGRTAGGRTDAEGNFMITGNFNKKVDLYIVFNNDIVQINRLPKRNFLETFFPAFQKIGTFKKEYWHDVKVDIPLSNPEPWSLSTIHNSIFEYNDFCDAFGYKKPDKKIVIWADENFLFSTSYAAPMLNHLDQNDRGNIADILENMLGIAPSVAMPLSNLANVGLPDIYSHYFTRNPTTRLRKTMFHEMTHASHYMQIGDEFWVKYISYIVKNGGYGTETSTGNGIVAYAEGWADDLSYECLKHTFGNYLTYNPDNIANEWIIYGLFYDLVDTADEGNDAVSGISFPSVYQLFTPEVDHPLVLKAKIKESLLSGPSATAEGVDALFHRHGY